MNIRAMLPGVASLALLLGATQDKPKSIKDAMNSSHKGKESMVAKVNAGKGTDEDFKKLVEIYEFLATQKAPQGDEASWKSKTAALVSASKDLVDKKAGALEAFTKASDCKSCHTVHRPKK